MNLDYMKLFNKSSTRCFNEATFTAKRCIHPQDLLRMRAKTQRMFFLSDHQEHVPLFETPMLANSIHIHGLFWEVCLERYMI